MKTWKISTRMRKPRFLKIYVFIANPSEWKKISVLQRLHWEFATYQQQATGRSLVDIEAKIGLEGIGRSIMSWGEGDARLWAETVYIPSKLEPRFPGALWAVWQNKAAFKTRVGCPHVFPCCQLVEWCLLPASWAGGAEGQRHSARPRTWVCTWVCSVAGAGRAWHHFKEIQGILCLQLCE